MIITYIFTIYRSKDTRTVHLKCLCGLKYYLFIPF